MHATPNNEDEDDKRTAKLRKQNVARVKRCRERKAGGGVVFTVDLSGNDIDALIAVGALVAGERSSPGAVMRAVMALSAEAYQARKANAVPSPDP